MMLKYFEAWLVLVVTMVVVFGGGRWFINFCMDRRDMWYGGFLLWMVGAFCVLAPTLIAGLFLVVWIVCGGW